MDNYSKYLKKVHEKLNSVIKKENFKSALKGFYVMLIFLVTFFIIINFLELAGKFNSNFRSYLFYAFLLLTAISLLYYVIYPLIKCLPVISKPDYFKTADKVGRVFPSIKDELINALQLLSDRSGYYSKTLINAAFEKIYEKSKTVNFSEAITFKSTKKFLRIAVIFISVAVLFFVFIPGLRASTYRILHYDQDFISPPKFSFEVNPGNAKITKGDDVKISVKVIGDVPKEITIASKSLEQTEFENKKIIPDSTGVFNYTVNAVRASFDYYAYADNIYSDVFKISVINRPVIKNFEVTVTPPAYSKLPQIVQKDNGNISSLFGSRAVIKLNSTKKLTNANLVFSDSSQLKFEIDENFAEANLRIVKNTDYFISLTDSSGNQNINPITYSIKTFVDEYPVIEVIAPNKNMKLTEDENISLILKISDDYGFARLVLHHRLSASAFEEPHENFSQITIPISKNKKEEDVYFVWNLSDLVLAADDVVSYYLEVFDNDYVSGPKSAKSSLFTIRVPSLDEILADAENTQTEAEKELVETLKEAKELNEELEKISDELKQNNKEISWEEKENIEKAVEKFQELESKVEDISQKLSEMQQELMENNLLSEETLEKYMELQELMNELSSEEMKQAFEKMQQMLQDLMRDKVQQSFEDLKMNEEMFQKSIERTINLLKRIQVEQKVDELLKRTEELAQKQEELSKQNEQSDLSDESQREELSKRQNELTESMRKLEEEMQKLKEKMSGLNDMPMQEMEKILEEYQKQNNEELSEEAMEQMMQQMKMQSMQNQQQISENMQQMNQQLQNMQQSMQMQNQMQVLSDMMKILDNLLQLSKEQESLKENSKNLPPNSPQFRENSQLQNQLQRNLDKLLQQMVELSQKTFAITPEMGKALGEARAEMNKSIGAMQNRNGSLSYQSQGNAMKSLNEAASLMKGSMDQMMSGGQGGGMMSLMQQLQQMAQQQMNLNQMTQMLRQGQMTQEQLSQMQRLGREQEMIRKSLEQLNKETRETGQSKKLSANLEKILQEMQEVVTGMQTQKLDDDLVQNQERILSKLLDAQRSINERDFEKNRESLTGKNFSRESPPELILATEKGKDQIKDELMRAIREGYTKDYEDLIRKYFEALQKDINKN